MFEPQPGPQTQFLASQADFAIYGGGAGGGKTWALLMEAGRHYQVRGFSAVVFRRTTPEIKSPGGLWDQSVRLYQGLGRPLRGENRWQFKSGATIKFSHMEKIEDRLAWAGSEIVLIGWDELQAFEEEQFWFLLSRARGDCGVRPYIRATCNPDPDSFVAKLVEWWLDPVTGLAIPERSGVLRWFARVEDELVWADSKQSLQDQFGSDCAPMSFTFIPALVTDNKFLLKRQPGYLAALKSLPRIERERLLGGNWKVRASAGMFFRREYFEIVGAAPATGNVVRYWDRAGSEGTGDYTVGLRMRRDEAGVFYVEDVVRFRGTALAVENAIRNTASQDGPDVRICLEQDPGSAGKSDVGHLVRALAGYNVAAVRVTTDKQTRARPASAQAEARNIKIVRGGWNDALLNELESFPASRHDDQVDCLSGALNELAAIFRVMLA